MMTMASMIPAPVPPNIDLGFEFGPVVLFVVLAVLAVGVLGSLLSVHAADREMTESEKPYVSLHLRPSLRTP
jgi:hypothetical protein